VLHYEPEEGHDASHPAALQRRALGGPAAPPALEDLTGWTTGRLASYKKPTGLVVLAELPRNASGKVLKHELRARYSPQKGGSSEKLPPSEAHGSASPPPPPPPPPWPAEGRPPEPPWLR
jgi:acyl-CoA synthetase (AMP-forming)/AMP-acid ligase II